MTCLNTGCTLSVTTSQRLRAGRLKIAKAVAAATGEDSGDTDIFIRPGFQFRAIDALVTNFHLPKSTLLMLVAAFTGYDRMQRAYRTAVAERYRFFSYGDAMFLPVRANPTDV